MKALKKVSWGNKTKSGQPNTVTAKQSLHCKGMSSRHSYGDTAASVHLMMMIIAMMTLVLGIVGVWMLDLRAIS